MEYVTDIRHTVKMSVQDLVEVLKKTGLIPQETYADAVELFNDIGDTELNGVQIIWWETRKDQ